MRRRTLPKHRYIALSAATVVIAAAGTLTAVAAFGGDGEKTSGSTAVAAAAQSPDATATAGPSASTSASPSSSASASASASGSPSASPSSSSGKASTHSGSSGTTARQSTTTVTGGGSGTAGLRSPAVFTGKAFDTCTAPPLSTMNAWHASSPYGAAAVYVGGQNRGCAQPQLTASWVRSVHASGWQLIPLYVGAQPPCQSSDNPERITASNAASLGASDGADAVAKASALGMGSGSAVYLDMEAYSADDTSCAQTVQTYVQAWDRALHARGYWAGFYGFSSSSAAAIARAKAAGTPDLPDALWYARYDGAADTTSDFPFSSGLWTGHRRGHQYAVNQRETYGGATVTVDHDAWDAPVAVIG